MVNLNLNQKKAVEATEGHVRVVAGAGSGKTRVLAHRYAYLVNELGISPGNILCLTFTNKAAFEMKKRIAMLVDRGSINDFICTIHSFCVKFLRREIYRIGYPKNFIIIDEDDCCQLAKQAMQDFGIDRKKTTAERFLKQVAGFKGMDPDAYILRYLMPGSSPECPDAIARYIRLQLKQYALDFDDLLYFTLHILLHYPDARQWWTDKLNYIMVDEVQDCTGDDWKLLGILNELHGNLFVVGDPDQAIYEWRGAAPRIFVNFKAPVDIILNHNYRSTPEILETANKIIDHNHNRVKKDLFSLLPKGECPIYHHAKTEKDEAEMIASRIAEGVDNGADYNSFAVLYRASFISRHIEQALLKHHIPYTVWGGVRFFERREIKDVICYLRLIASDNDDMAFRRIVNVPSRKFGLKSLETLETMANDNSMSLMSTLRNIAGEDLEGVKPSIRLFITLIDEARQRIPLMMVSELTDWLLNESGLALAYRTDEMEERLENLAELINSMKEFERSRFEQGEGLLNDYLQEISLYINSDHEEGREKVKLMTIHQAKGLEFDTVFVAGLTEGIFPSHRTIRERRKDGEEEERRLMYVAVTRAMNHLILSESEGFLNDTGGLKYPSRFISEIPDSLLTVEGKPDPSLFAGTKNMVALLDAQNGDKAESPIENGTKVIHKVFGEGVVESYDAASKSYRIKFATGIRNLLPHVIRTVTP